MNKETYSLRPQLRYAEADEAEEMGFASEYAAHRLEE